METNAPDPKTAAPAAPAAPAKPTVEKAPRRAVKSTPAVEPTKEAVPVSEGVSADPGPHGLPSMSEMKARKGARKPFGAMDQKLYWPAVPGWHLHWFNDVSNNIMEADAHGYVHILDKDGKKVKRGVGSHPNQPGGMSAFLMAIPQEWYEESKRAEQAELDKFDADLRKGAVDGTPGEDGRYVPEDSTGKSRIKIETETGKQT